MLLILLDILVSCKYLIPYQGSSSCRDSQMRRFGLATSSRLAVRTGSVSLHNPNSIMQWVTRHYVRFTPLDSNPADEWLEA